MADALEQVSTSPTTTRWALIAAAYLQYLLAGNRRAACTLVLDAAKTGEDVREIYLKVLQPVQHEVGRLWQNNIITVAVEHFCTAVTQLIISQLFPYVITDKKNGLSMIGCCVGNDLHEIGMRMVCDFFEMDGWETYYMGANCPMDAIVSAVSARRPDVLCMSVTMHKNVLVARNAIQAVKQINQDVKIIVGGFPFLLNPDLACSLGAHGWGKDALEGVQLATALCGARRKDAA